MINRYFYFNFLRKTYVFVAKQLKKLLGLNDDPHKIALGTAIGLFAALIPFIPQMLVGFLIACALKANRVAAVIPAWVSNPITALPLLFTQYTVGSFVLGQETIAKEDFAKYLSRIVDLSFFKPSELYEQLKSLFIDSWHDVGHAVVIGSIITGIIAGFAIYPVTKKAVLKYRENKQRKKDLWKASLNQTEDLPDN